MNLLSNGSFEALGWRDIPVPGIATINQEPPGVKVRWLEPGTRLRSADSYTGPDDEPHYLVAETIPEIVHKGYVPTNGGFAWNLPEIEQPGQPKALVIDGDRCLDIFSSVKAFGVDVEVSAMAPADGVLHITTPVQVHEQGDGSPGAAVWRLIVDGDPHPWRTFGDGFEDRQWAAAEHVMGVEAGQVVTAVVQLESRALGGIDFFLDDWRFDFTPTDDTPEEPPAPSECPLPRAGWDTRTTVLVRFDAPHAAWMGACAYADDPSRQHDVCRSWDHLFWSPGIDHVIGKLWYDVPNAFDLDEVRAWGAEHYPTIDIELRPVGPHAPDGGEPAWTPTNYIPRGTKLGWHAIGNCGLPELYTEAGIQAPTIKLVQAIADIGTMPTPYRVVRLIDAPGYGNLSGFSYTQDPELQAEARIAALADLLEPLRGQFEWAEYINEQDIPDTAGAANLARFCKRAMEVAPDWLGLAHFSFGPGNPSNLDFWQPIADSGLFEQIAARGDAIALHAYYDHRIPDDLKWLMLRHRYLYNDHILPRRLDIPCLITEIGPWEHLLEDDDYDLMAWVRVTDEALAQDPYVMAHMYTVSDVKGWATYNYAFKGIYPEFIAYAQSVADRDNPDGTVPATPEDPEDPPAGGPDPDPPVPIPFSQRDKRWADVPLGESEYTMRGSGCLVTAFASLLTLTDTSMDPLQLVTWLNDRDAFTEDGLLYIAYPAEMSDDWEFGAYHTWTKAPADMATVRRLLAAGPTILGVDFVPATARYDSHFVLALREEDGDIVILDPWTGETCRLLETYGPEWTLERAIYAAIEYRRVDDVSSEPSPPPLLGFNDHDGQHGTGLKWLKDNGLQGLIVRPLFLGGTPIAVDATAAKVAGIRVILNLRYSWSTDMGGAGTLPAPRSPEWERFIEAAANTIRSSQGIWGYTISNEANNPREFPRDGRLQPGDVAVAYNAIRNKVADLDVRMAPGALDPYNAQAGDPRDWLRTIYGRIHGVEFVAAHGYIRGPDPALVGSTAKFQDDPLTWQYLNYPGCITALLQVLPAAYQDLPVYVTECNHLWTDGGEGAWGWVDDDRAATIVERVHIAAEFLGISGVALYRWAGDEWTIEGKTHILEAVRERLS